MECKKIEGRRNNIVISDLKPNTRDEFIKGYLRGSEHFMKKDLGIMLKIRKKYRELLY